MSSKLRLPISFCDDEDMFDMFQTDQTEKKNVDSDFLNQNALTQRKISYGAKNYPMCQGLPQKYFSIIYADPPFEYTRKVGSGVANNHYLPHRDVQILVVKMSPTHSLVRVQDVAAYSEPLVSLLGAVLFFGAV